jgi:hypothetical protein
MQKFFNALTMGSKKEETPTVKSPTPEVRRISTRSKEIAENIKEEEKIKIFGDFRNFKFDLKVFGRSIFQNLILTASAFTSDSEPIPIKCTWRRIKRDVAVYIQDVNSNSYMPTAEDIGYTIEVEASPIDGSIYGSQPAIGQYGPLMIDEDMKNTIELLLTSGGTKFSCQLFDIKEQEKITDKEILIYLNPNEFKIVETDYNGNEKVLEILKYNPQNPVIKLHSYDAYRLTVQIFEYHITTNSDQLKQSPKAEYHLVAMSKQCRELIYLLVNFFLIDEKLKNSKLFSLVNYNLLPAETKVGVTDLISEIKTLREENIVYMKNMKNLERVNRELKLEMQNLEEDFQITLESINLNSLQIEKDIEANKNSKILSHKTLNIGTTTNLSDSTSTIDVKKQNEELRINNSSLMSTEKALREDLKANYLQLEIMKNNCKEVLEDCKKLRAELNQREVDSLAFTKSFEAMKDSKNNLQLQYEQLSLENKKYKTFYETYANSIEDHKKESEEVIKDLKEKLSEINKAKESLLYENKNLIVQRNLLTNQKEIISKELEKLKKEKTCEEETRSKNLEDLENLKCVIKEKENINLHLNAVLENLKKEKKEETTKLELLEIEYKSIKDTMDKLMTQWNDSNETRTVQPNLIQITEEEWEEYDCLKKEKDEQDALIMQLMTNNEAKDLEIKNLKMLIDSFKK